MAALSSSTAVITALTDRYGLGNVYSSKLDEPCGVTTGIVDGVVGHGQYLYMPAAYGFDCYPKERIDLIDQGFRSPCLCKVAPPVDWFDAVRDGLVVGAFLSLLLWLAGTTMDGMDKHQCASPEPPEKKSASGSSSWGRNQQQFKRYHAPLSGKMDAAKRAKDPTAKKTPEKREQQLAKLKGGPSDAQGSPAGSRPPSTQGYAQTSGYSQASEEGAPKVAPEDPGSGQAAKKGAPMQPALLLLLADVLGWLLLSKALVEAHYWAYLTAIITAGALSIGGLFVLAGYSVHDDDMLRRASMAQAPKLYLMLLIITIEGFENTAEALRNGIAGRESNLIAAYKLDLRLVVLSAAISFLSFTTASMGILKRDSQNPDGLTRGMRLGQLSFLISDLALRATAACVPAAALGPLAFPVVTLVAALMIFKTARSISSRMRQKARLSSALSAVALCDQAGGLTGISTMIFDDFVALFVPAALAARSSDEAGTSAAQPANVSSLTAPSTHAGRASDAAELEDGETRPANVAVAETSNYARTCWQVRRSY